MEEYLPFSDVSLKWKSGEEKIIKEVPYCEAIKLREMDYSSSKLFRFYIYEIIPSQLKRVDICYDCQGKITRRLVVGSKGELNEIEYRDRYQPC